jgi:hypothetical protein
MSSANHSQPMQTYCGRVARKPRPDDRFLDFRVALAMSAMGHKEQFPPRKPKVRSGTASGRQESDA